MPALPHSLGKKTPSLLSSDVLPNQYIGDKYGFYQLERK
jgi:hypothetical protein